MDYFAQAVGIVAMLFNILSYQRKTGKGVIATQCCGSSLFAVNFFLLGAYGGAILNVIAAIRDFMFYHKDKLKTDRPLWTVVFTVIYFLSYGATFLVFKQTVSLFYLIVEFLPIIGMIATTLAFRYREAKMIRRFCLISSVSWLVYNFAVFSIGAIVCELSNV